MTAAAPAHRRRVWSPQPIGIGGGRLQCASMSRHRPPDGAALISLTNAHESDPPTIRIDLRGATVTDVVGRVLTAPSLDAHNTPENPAAVAPRSLDDVRVVGGMLEATLPPASCSTVQVVLEA
ncbi:alpha-L-arabinofuranosidase C-terminal domain-containing protein [Agromyces sp. SYSU T00266]|uniref:alpha-L-arabinofuranosidase C-terminal domain-containing protein n=1 Tax=Agromyces zhanjiangensis TaxID=3158562 RepID=UPI0033928571